MSSNQEMDKYQYNKLTEAIDNMASGISQLNGRFDDMDKKVTSISNWVTGDPNIPNQVGGEEKIKRLNVRVTNNEKALERIEKIDRIAEQVEIHEKKIVKIAQLDEVLEKTSNHEKKLDKIWTIYATIAVISTVIGAVIALIVRFL